MKNIIKTLLIVAILALGLMVITPKTYAVSGVFSYCNSNTAIQGSTVCKDVHSGANSTNDPVITDLKTTIDIISFIVGIAAVITIVVSGLRMVTGGGNPETVSSARSAIIYAVIGILIVSIAQLIVVFVLDKVG